MKRSPDVRKGSFKLSEDPLFIEKVRDVVGLYLNPPERAVVVCVDEKTGIQALDRTQPILPMRPGQVERRTHDYVRHGITDLFAALNIATGEVVSTTRRRHRAEEFKSFLSEIDKSVPAELDIHVVLDNSSTHKTEAVRNWLLRHPRFHLHFTPTSSSWLNLVWALVRRAHTTAAQTLGTPQRESARVRPQGMDRNLERESSPVRLEEDGRRDSRITRRLLPTHL